ncbi:RNA polymerase sigma factor [Streptomyces sp. NPDC046876]|uniref:RNA polymerase sigma factor n=1 Tax=Streptomyces sp. NPDC046876 TaxID=3155616 RepID=UPI0033F2E114
MTEVGPASGPVRRTPEELGSLVRRAQKGDTMAVSELMEILAPYVGRVCGPIALQDGADAAQEAMIAIFKGIHQLKTPEALFGWARAIAAREAVRMARKNQRTVPSELVEEPDPRDAELAADIEDTLAKLSPEHRAVLVMRHIEGLDEQTVAGLLDMPVGTVRSRLYRARSMFRRAWT